MPVRKRSPKPAVKPPAKSRRSVTRAAGAEQKALRDHVLYLLKGGGAHVDFAKAVGGLPAELQGGKTPGLPFTPWRLLEHIRIAQRDILEFTRNPKHVSPSWPHGYWPPADAPPAAGAWERSVAEVKADLNALERLVANPKTDLYARIPHGEGQTVLREALLVADHNAYHLGQLVMLRRLLGSWHE